MKPILFSTEMVQAIFDLSKTQTRRIIKYRKKIENPKVGFTAFTPAGSYSVRGKHEDGKYGESFFKLPYQKGDILWVRETWRDMKKGYDFKADYPHRINFRWKPSIFMPRKACRLFLKIKSVRIERLHDISEEDARAEGMQTTPGTFVSSLKMVFKGLWDKINGKRAPWKTNPFVWVIEFEKTNITA